MKSLYFLLALFLSLISIHANAQTPAWAWVKSDIGGFDLATDKAGNVYVIGGMNGSIFLQKISSSGDSIWTKKISGGPYSFVNAITVDASGNVYIIGDYNYNISFDTIHLTNNGYDHVFIAKYDSSGIVKWARTSNGISSSSYSTASFQVATDAQGNVYFNGRFNGKVYFNTDTVYGSRGFFIVKFNPDGDLQWLKTATIDSGGTNSYSFGIATDNWEHVYITGWITKDAIFGQDTLLIGNSEMKMYIAKMKADGDFIWAKTYAAEESVSLGTDSLGSVYVSGSRLGQIFIAKFDSSGAWVWDKDIGSSVYSKFSKTDKAGNTYIPGVYGGAVAKFNPDGNLVWAKYNTGDEFFACPALNGDVYTTGTYRGTAYFLPYVLTTSGSQISLPFLGKLSFITSITETLNKEHRILVYPNPSSGIINILAKDYNGVTITVYNSFGKICYAHQDAINNQYTSLNLEHLVTGIYFLELKNKEHSSSQKIIIQH